MKETDAQKLQDEYARLVAGLGDEGGVLEEDDLLSTPVLPEDMVAEAIPGNIRKAEHFVAFMKRFIEYLKVRYSSQVLEDCAMTLIAAYCLFDRHACESCTS